MWLLDGLWQRLGVAEALRGVLGARRFTTDVERVQFALVCNRAVDPMSKLLGRSGPHMTRRSRGLRGWTTIRPTGRWTCW